jgi:mRNA interferase MazF
VTFAAFDVIVVPFPYSDRLAEKRRPALVVSAPALELSRGLVWVAMITSATHSTGFADCEIHDLASAGLPARSMLRGGKLATIEPLRVIRRTGSLSTADRKQAEQVLRSCAAF